MRRYGINFWKQVPFLRLLIPSIAGILLGYYSGITVTAVIIAGSFSLSAFILFRFLPNSSKYRRGWVNGVFINLVWVAYGFLLCYFSDIRRSDHWIGNFDLKNSSLAVTVAEPLTEKDRSYKTTARIYAICINNKWIYCSGRMLVYLSKQDQPDLQYGDHLFFSADILPIRNSGNPGGFDYSQYCSFQGVYHQVYLRKENYFVIKEKKWSFNGSLFVMRDWILALLKKYVPGNKESGVAEALLVGYRNDLDRDLVQAYSKTGVVHIIAISGLHLGMIYGLLVGVVNFLPRTRIILLLKPVVILTVLWGFSLLTGAAASILRSAVMFSFIVIGQCLDRRSNIYNTLAASAFFLLLYNPYFMWDVGFLLSYTAVLSIVVFMRHVYKWIYIKNKLLNNLWQLNSVTISAQLLTLPLVLFCFHQFPNLFLFTNGVAVPLSGLILYAELLLPVFASFPFAASLCGNLVSILVKQMDGYIERTASLPFSVTGNIDISLFQTVVLYLLIFALARWLLFRKNSGFLWGLCLSVLFIIPASVVAVNSKRQQKLVVYQIQGHTAIDVIEGNRCRFIGNDTVTRGLLNSFVLSPARLLYHVRPDYHFKRVLISGQLVAGPNKRVLIINRWPPTAVPGRKLTVDMIILCGDLAISPRIMSNYFNCSQYVFDGSIPLWKIQYWKKEADSLHLRHHSTPEQGAFEMDL